MTVDKRYDGGQAIVELLRRNGVDRVFTVPGESFLPVLDALHDASDIALVVCRQEGGASMMAEAYAKTTGRPGVCFVTRGPGSANALAGLHVASQDSTPLLVFVGQVPRGFQQREAWQEVDVGALFGSVAKWAVDIQDAARLPEYLSRAFTTARSGRQGPVVLGLPEDLLFENVMPLALDAAPVSQGYPAPAAMAQLQQMLSEAQRPLAIFGGSGWNAECRQALLGFAEAQGLPVVTAFRRQDRFDNSHPNYAGDAGLGMNPALAKMIQEADLLMAVGTRLGDITTRHYELVEAPRPHQRLVHVHPDPQAPGQVYWPELAVCASVANFADAAAGLSPPAALSDERRAWLTRAREIRQAWQQPTQLPGPLQLGEIVAWLGNRLPADAVISNGAGNYTLWVHRFYPFRGWGSQLAPTSGSMGYGLPAAIAAKLAQPMRPAVCFAGDGCFQMTCQELATAVQYGANVIIVVVNNGSYGSIRMHQDKHYPGRRYGTDLVNPDMVTLAKAYGAAAARVERTEQFADVFEQALACDRPFLIELMIDPAILRP
ncbi:thiamine pyrophosphate-binding protein [Ectopseudomonas mendocina]|uniref:Thiamine pyrophosphate-binding protein n=1 Tax=Ectopseudomonas mendocina TaxID=300 RepID=A0ABD7RW16_ECTME|nr:thiamine pyrophosphate-binding protein [Pseudomonas mendocina]TRO13484.1 thiamine pyrophosphate-binding protein [Pseudomonas mendocina]TRO18752.1 thiamine pyrophosphate-binding protein [Pseudomonas mendocina]